MKTEIPSESYLIKHRIITFFDEWLFYLVLGILFFTDNRWWMILVALHGALFIFISYRRQWKIEEMRFGNADADNKN